MPIVVEALELCPVRQFPWAYGGLEQDRSYEDKGWLFSDNG
jgi:hypothetical protein